MHGIERRAKHDLFSFMFVDEEKYLGLDYYTPCSSDYIEIVKDVLSNNWQYKYTNGIWFACMNCTYEIPNNGFKIHLSTNHKQAADLLYLTSSILLKYNTCFKFIVDERALSFTMSQSYSRLQCGKFITIYPTDTDIFTEIIKELYEKTHEFYGPYIITDKRYKDSKIIYYRFGAFKNINRVNMFGEFDSYILTEAKELINDERRPYFHLPDGIEDTFPTPNGNTIPEKRLIKNRYMPIKALSFSPKGGVYLCYDNLMSQEVILKEARPYINISRSNQYDAIDCLKNEYYVLTKLSKYDISPRPIEFFHEWEHAFIAMHKIEGTPLSSYHAYNEYSIMLKTNYSDQDLRAWCYEYLEICKRITEIIEIFHSEDIIIQDLAPQNIIINNNLKCVKLIDFEGAYINNDEKKSIIIPLVTQGFGDVVYADRICQLLNRTIKHYQL